MKLATVRADGATALAAVTEGGVLDLSGGLAGCGRRNSVDTLCAVMADQPDALARLTDAAVRPTPRRAADEVQVMAPLPRPGKVICIGLSYRDHCREAGIPEPGQPVMFAKFSSARRPDDPGEKQKGGSARSCYTHGLSSRGGADTGLIEEPTAPPRQWCAIEWLVI